MVKLIENAQIAVLNGYTITGYNSDGSPKVRAHSKEVAAGEVFIVTREHAEALIRDGHARLAPRGDGASELI